MQQSIQTGERRISSVDALRGLASLVVVLWHWPHFLQAARSEALPLLPLYEILWPFYRYGAWGVDLFFCISGFVFFTHYAGALAQRQISAFRFGLLRFSRLYPLHLLTLLYVAAVQPVYSSYTSHAYVYADNSLAAFGLQLGLASNWWPHGYSFNGPIWSVSVEILLYLSFFVTATTTGMKPLVLFALGVAGMLLMPVNEEVGRGFAAFYAGCLCGILVSSIKAREFSFGACLALIALAALWSQTSILRAELIVKWLAFPGAVVVLALFDGMLDPVSRHLRWLGDISYSSYLIHFPLQLTIVTLSVAFGRTVDFSSPLTLAGFFATLVVLSGLSFRLLERPAMRLIRTWRPVHVVGVTSGL